MCILNDRISSAEHPSISFLIVSNGSLIRGSTRLLRYKGFDIGAVQQNLAPNPQYLEPSFLDESRDGLPGNAANARRFRL